MTGWDVPGNTWEERMANRAAARATAAEDERRAFLQGLHREAVEWWTQRMPALPGETRILEGDHAGHLEHLCGTAHRCSCGAVRNPVCVVVIPGEEPECPICQARGLPQE